MEKVKRSFRIVIISVCNYLPVLVEIIGKRRIILYLSFGNSEQNRFNSIFLPSIDIPLRIKHKNVTGNTKLNSNAIGK